MTTMQDVVDANPGSGIVGAAADPWQGRDLNRKQNY
jgi:hypothetical protein